MAVAVKAIKVLSCGQVVILIVIFNEYIFLSKPFWILTCFTG